jgi:hypothetical protein
VWLWRLVEPLNALRPSAGVKRVFEGAARKKSFWEGAADEEDDLVDGGRPRGIEPAKPRRRSGLCPRSPNPNVPGDWERPPENRDPGTT